MNAPSATPSPSSSHRFPKSNRILHKKDFRRVYDQGVKYNSRLFAAFCLETAESDRTAPRVGFTVPRAIGKAVIRNRVRRRIREAVRLDLARLGPRWDIVLNPRRAVLDAPFDDLRNEVRKLVSRCKP